MLTAVVYLSRWVDGETIKRIVVGKEQLQTFMNAITIYATLPENCGQKILVQPVPHQLGSIWKPHPMLKNMYNYVKISRQNKTYGTSHSTDDQVAVGTSTISEWRLTSLYASGLAYQRPITVLTDVNRITESRRPAAKHSQCIHKEWNTPTIKSILCKMPLRLTISRYQ